MLEHVTQELGEKYLAIIKDQSPEFLDQLDNSKSTTWLTQAMNTTILQSAIMRFPNYHPNYSANTLPKY
jgi:hypothetical protein